MENFLGLLSPGAIMAFLLTCASMYLILQVAKEDAKYSLRLKQFLLWLAWPVFFISVLTFLGLMFSAVLPVLQEYHTISISAKIDPSVYILFGIYIVFGILFYVITRFVITKLEPWMPKTKKEKEYDKVVANFAGAVIKFVKLVEKDEKKRDKTNRKSPS